MTRLTGVFLSVCIASVLFAAQDPEVDQIGREALRLMKAQADELEAMFKNPDRKNLAERDKKVGEIGDSIERLEKRVKKLSPENLMSLREKYGQDMDLAEQRVKTALAKLGIKDWPGDPKNSKQDPKKDSPKTESPQDIAKRIQDNMKKANERLKMNDPGKETVKTQEDIMKDLEELLKQKNPDGGGGGGGGGGGNPSGGGSSSSTGNSSINKGSSGAPSGGNNGGGGGNQSGGQDKKDPMGKKEDKEQGGGQKPDPKNGDGGGQKPDPPNGDGGAGKPKDPKDKEKGKGGGIGDKGLDGNLRNPDAKVEEWGQLPKTKRQEMETYARDQFMRRYENDLRQYYRAIAEQSRRD